MLILKEVNAWLEMRDSRFAESSLGFVPTMGALHEGHMSLIEYSIRENNVTVVSIFLNPTQFNDPKDLNRYPKTLDHDIALLETAGVDVLILPDFEQVYPDEYRYKILESDFSRKLCGASRPGHFDGVLTVVMKLLNIVKAQKAYFGEKDYQQFVLIREMVKAFFMKTEIISCPTIRETDGLAFSSRNARLTSDERLLAPQFYKSLSSNDTLISQKAKLASSGFKVDYLEERDGRRYGAVYLGKVRLIDNVAI